MSKSHRPASSRRPDSGAVVERDDDNFYRLAFEHAAVGMLELDARGRTLRANPRLCEFSDYSEAELLCLPVFGFLDPRDAKKAFRAWRRFLRAGEARTSGEFRLKRKRGDVAWAQVSVSRTPSASGRPRRLIVIVEDILARKAAEEALRASEERFRLAMQGANEGLFDWNIVENIPYQSPRWLAMLGYAEGEIVVTPDVWRAMLAPGMHERFEDLYRQLESGAKSTYECELRLRHKDGHWVDVLARAYPVFDENHKMVRLVGTHFDITERKRHEADLRRAAAVFENTHEGIVVFDPSGIIVNVNPAYERITGFDRSEAIGQRYDFRSSNRHVFGFYDDIFAAVRAEGHWEGEIWKRRKDGGVYPEWVTVSALRDELGALVNFISVFADISKLKQSEARLDFLAHHDPLTSLPNRLLLTERIAAACQAAARDGRMRALLFLDLDRFKTINDSLGHAAGDELLLLACERWRRRLRPCDTLARVGGDEFVALVDADDSPLGVTRLAHALIEDSSHPFVFADGREAYVGLSIGVTLFANDEAGPDLLIQRADSALFEAKATGGASRYYSPSQTRAARARLDTEAGLRRALQRDEFALQFQPQVRLADQRTFGVEALIRWRSPAGLAPPMDFIPLAEKTGLIVPIGDWVLRESCRRMKCWLDAGLDIERIAVNLSPRQFDLSDIRNRIAAALDESGLPPQRLEIEITETALMEQGGNATRKLESLKALGVRIAVDDFGTGHSSLSYLKRFPIDLLKLDRAFIVDIPGDPKSMEIAAAIIRLGHSLHVDVLAEGVETKAQADFLALAGCPSAQGFLFAKPMWEADWLANLEGAARRPRRAIGA